MNKTVEAMSLPEPPKLAEPPSSTGSGGVGILTGTWKLSRGSQDRPNISLVPGETRLVVNPPKGMWYNKQLFTVKLVGLE